jgi:hypothetical protein
LELLQLLDTALFDLVVYIHSGGCGGGDSGTWEHAGNAVGRGSKKDGHDFLRSLNAGENLETSSYCPSPARLEFERLIALLLDQPLFFGDTDEVTAKLAETEKYDLLIHFLHERYVLVFFCLLKIFLKIICRAMHAAALRILQNKEESLLELKERMSARKHTVALMHRNLDVGGGDSKEVNDPRSLLAEGDTRCAFLSLYSCFIFLCLLLIELFTT